MRRTGLLLLLALALSFPAAGAEVGEGLVSLQAAQQQWIQEELWCGIGDVEIHYQDISLRCDEIEVDLKSLRLRARGNIVFDQGNTRLACDEMEFDLRAKTGVMRNVDAFFPPNYHFRGEELEKLDATHYRFHRGVFTSCDLSDDHAPPWSIHVRDAVVELEGYGHFRGASVRVRGVPVFYTPRLLWPVKTDRAAGLLVPDIGYNDRHGAYLGNSFFWPVGRSFDTTFYLDLYSEGFVGLGNEMRWAPTETARGEVLFETLYNPDYDAATDPQGNQWEWKLHGKHNQLFAGGWALRAEVNDLSNLDFFQRFERTFDQNALRALYSHVTLSRTWGPQAFNLRADHRKTFFSDLTQPAVELDRQPELEYRLRATPVGRTPLYVSMVALADRFRINRSETLRGNYSRYDLFPQVSLLTSGLPWLSVTPTLGGRVTHYTATYSEDRKHLVEEPLTRKYATAGLSLVGPSFSRIFQTGEDSKLKHLVEPRIEYIYVSDPGDTSRIPIFDEKDSVLVRNRATVGIVNRFFLKRGDAGSREVASLEVSQDYSFSEPLTLGTQDRPPSQYGPLSVWLRAAPIQGATFDARASFDAISKNLRSTSLSGGVNGRTAMVNLTWFAGYSPDGSVSSSQTRIHTGFGPSAGPWRLEAALNYDIHNSKLLDQRYLLRWRGSCWSAYMEVRDYRIEPYTRRDYRISVDLTGLGRFLDIRGGLDSLR